jgi:5'-nucleotidase
MELQQARLEVPAKPGVAFQLVKKLLAFNTAHARNVEVVILSRNDPVSALRIFARPKGRPAPGAGVFTQGRDPFRYLRPLGRTCFCRPTSRT